MKLPNNNTKKGFTLIELLIVIAIIGILISIGLASFSRAQRQARDGQRKADIEQIRGALEQYYGDNDVYPPQANWQAELDGSSGSGVIYLRNIPTNPDGGNYIYTNPGGDQSYCVSTNLEIPPPADSPTCDGNNYGLSSQD